MSKFINKLTEMVVKVGINGFGRIGRVIFRTCHQNDGIELSAINDPAIDAEYICYLIKFDSTHGKFNGIVTRCGDEIKVDNHQIKIFREKLPINIPWREAGVQYVVEASGMFTTLEKASGHLKSETVKRVIVTAPSTDVPMIILGVNNNTLQLNNKVLSCASSTLYCLAPIIKVLEDNFGVAEGFMTSIHAMTPSLKPLDGLCLKGKHWRDHRSIHQNIIPASTGACKALGKVIPEVKDKISGLAFRIPIVNVSVLDLSIRLTTNTTIPEIVDCITSASNAHLKDIIKISKEDSVSSDFIGDSHSCILDLDSSLQLNTNFFKLICWYENEYSYACRVVDSIFFSERQLYQVHVSSEVSNINAKTCKENNEVRKSVAHTKEFIDKSGYNAVKGATINKVASLNNTFNVNHRDCHVVLNKPLSSHRSGTASLYTNTREYKRRNEMFKIWKETNETPIPDVRQNTELFFQRCISDPKHNTVPSQDRILSQERLEKVKKEFTKMVNITKDLLKKSHINTVHLGTPINDFEVIDEPPTKINIQKDNQLIISTKEKNSTPILDICGDYKASKEKVISICSKENIKTTYDIYKNSVVNCTNSQVGNVGNSSGTHTQSDLELTSNDKDTINDCANLKISDHIVNLKKSYQFKHKMDFKDQVAKTLNTLIDGLTQNLQIHVALHENSERHSKVLHSDGMKITKDSNDGDKKLLTDTNGMNALDVSVEDIIKDDLINTKIDTNQCKITADENHDESHYLLINNTNFEENVTESYKLIENEQSTAENNSKKVMLSKQILDRLNRFTHKPVFEVNEDDIQSTRNYCLVEQNKSDVYDKLDSASASDSENSFEIHARKSQILDITDLTNSIEDLANLERICNIIEISDELSDKLFSTLKNSDCQGVANKKWSFKDLCQRIKLDEFCNNIFGKTVT